MYTLPPEWAKQSGVMLTWPHQETIWAETLPAIDAVFVRVASEIAKHEALVITCADEKHQAHITALLQQANVNLSRLRFHLAQSNDIWVRDHGPLSVLAKDQALLLDFTFNGWGNKYPADLDNQITRTLHLQTAFDETPLQTIDMVLEGGAIEVDGLGTLLTTSSCLLSSSRNPKLTQTQITEKLQTLLGLKRILWLDEGYLAGDDTDGHIDTLARFINPNAICYVSCDDTKDEHFKSLKAMETQLQSFKNNEGEAYQLIALPWPRARYAAVDGRRLPATYANFLLINDAVLVPTYDDPADEKALKILTACFPDRKIIGIPSLAVIQWYGSLHCMTMQLPEGVLK